MFIYYYYYYIIIIIVIVIIIIIFIIYLFIYFAPLPLKRSWKEIFPCTSTDQKQYVRALCYAFLWWLLSPMNILISLIKYML